MSLIQRITDYKFNHDARYGAWDIGLKEGIKKPIFGHGQENFYTTYINLPANNKDKQYIRSVEPGANFDRVHNQYINYFFDGGIIYLFLMLYLFWYSLKISLRTNSYIFYGCFIAFFIHLFFAFDVLISSVLFLTVFSYVYSNYKAKIY